MRSAKSESGYTLMELLVAVAILAMMALPLSAGIHLGLNAWRSTMSKSNVFERDMLVRERLAAWLTAAYPFDKSRRTDMLLYPFEGTDQSLTFVAPTAPDPRANSLNRVSVKLQDGQLTAGFTPDAMSYDVKEPAATVSLLDGVASWSLAYLDGTTNPTNPQWVSSWTGQTGLPDAVRIRLAFKDTHRMWPDLVAPLVIKQWSFCKFQDTGQSCETGATAG